MPLRLCCAALFLLSGLGLAACGTPVERHPFAELTFGQKAPFRLDVAVVDVVNDYEAPPRPPHVEHLFPVRPADAAAQWAKDRLVAAGSEGAARFTVLTASAVAVPLEQTTGIRGFFTEDQSERYDAALEVRLDVENADGLRTGTVSARARRSVTVAEGATLNEREQVWYEMTEALMRDFDAELERNIRRHLGAFLR